MVANQTPKATGRRTAQLKPSAVTPPNVIPSEIIEIDPYRIWQQNRKSLAALGCPDQPPRIVCGRFNWFDNDGSISIAYSAPGLRRMQWAIASNERLSECLFASFELPTGQMVSLDLQRHNVLEVTISNSEEEEAQVLARWINALRFDAYHWVIQGE